MDIQFQNVVEFISPYEEEFNFIAIGDDIPRSTYEFMKYVIENTRNEFTLPEAKFHKYTLSDVFKGKTKDLIQMDSTIVYMDAELTSKYFKILMNNQLNSINKELNPLDVMLIKEFIIKNNNAKCIFNILLTPNKVIKYFTNHYDATPAINYLIDKNYMGVTNNKSFLDEFTDYLIEQYSSEIN